MPRHDTREHARAFLGRVDKDIGLRQVAAAFRQAQPDISKWKSGELGRWCVDQATHIAGTKSLDEIVRNQDVLTLTALGYLALAEVGDVQPPKSPTMPTPLRLNSLEDGFLRALLDEANRDAAASPEFRNCLEKAKGRVSQLARSLGGPIGAEPAPSPGGTLAAQASNDGWGVIDLLAIVCAVAGLVAGLTKKST